MTEQIRLNVGDTAPAFTLTNDKGETVSLSDYAGQRVIVYFYPCLLYTSDAADDCCRV